jgi:hypothetical protein
LPANSFTAALMVVGASYCMMIFRFLGFKNARRNGPRPS